MLRSLVRESESSSVLDSATGKKGPVFISIGLLRTRCGFSKLDARGFIGDFERFALACFHGDRDKRGVLIGRNELLTPHRAAVGSDRATHQIAVLKRSKRQKQERRVRLRLLWILLSR
jgi:hypothetical protein